jgi:seryl-tRNA synthetase
VTLLESATAEGLLPDPFAPGIYGRTSVFEGLLEHVDAAITGLDLAHPAEIMRFPPVIGRRIVEQCGYVDTFPHLLGSVHAFVGDDLAHTALRRTVAAGEDWGAHQSLTDVVLTPAACYAVYPRLTGGLPTDGRLLDVESWCFRQEPSHAAERMRAFRMREFVRVGAPDAVREWRAAWLPRAGAFLTDMGLAPSLAPANDPFFGGGRRFLAASQREQELKFEWSVDVTESMRAAVISANSHLDHFGEAFGIRLPDGELAHTACVGFGLERLVLALFTAHGHAPVAWPAAVRTRLRLTHSRRSPRRAAAG